MERPRLRMVDEQLKSRGVSDVRVLDVMRAVPRHLFVDAAVASHAYSDSSLPIGGGQTISQPYMVAKMTQLLELQGHERVLEIGTGCGYQTAVLARLCRRVYSIERIDFLHTCIPALIQVSKGKSVVDSDVLGGSAGKHLCNDGRYTKILNRRLQKKNRGVAQLFFNLNKALNFVKVFRYFHATAHSLSAGFDHIFRPNVRCE